MRQVILDTETTGLEVDDGHRIIEIGCLEMVGRKLTGERFHAYLDPERDIEEGAVAVHGIRNADLAGKPKFADIAQSFLGFIADAELVIHNAPFDVGFINRELAIAGVEPADVGEHCSVLDTLAIARNLHPGQRNSLDALCKRYDIDASQRTQHGALLDASLLAEVYLAMTGGQAALGLDGRGEAGEMGGGAAVRHVDRDGLSLVVVRATDAERAAHAELVAELGDQAIWSRGRGA